MRGGLVLFFVVLLSGFGSSRGDGICRPSDMNALLGIADGFLPVSPGSQSTKGWINGTNCCDWSGVVCSTEAGVTVILELSLSGVIPNPNNPGLWEESLLQLRPTLKTLHLEEVYFNGHFPNVFTEMTALRVLAMFYTKMTGPIPKEIENLVNLDTFIVEEDFPDPEAPFHGLTGSIPSEVCKLKELTSFSIMNNELTGEIPDCIGEMLNLTLLALMGNQLTGRIPASIGRLSKLSDLILTGNRLTGPIPPEIGMLSSLVYCDMDGNLLSGPLPKEISQLQNLFRIQLNGNRITGSIPAEWGNSSGLFQINLRDNKLSGEIPATLSNIRGLAYLYLGNNSLTGQIPPMLSSYCSREPQRWDCALELRDNRLYGFIPQQLLNVTLYPMTIDLSNNSLSGIVPTYVGTHLISFTASHNYLTGGFPLEFASINTVDLSFNSLHSVEETGTLPSSYPSSDYNSRIQDLNLSNNWMKGPFPQWLLRLTSLTSYDLSNNILYGTVPAGAFDLSGVTSINISHNYFYDTLPLNPFANSSVIELLDLHHNSFYGEITPSFWAVLDRLGIVTLDLSENRLWGALLWQIGSIGPNGNGVFGTYPKHLDFSDNFLGAYIPRSIGNLMYLEYLDLSNNHFIGTVPASVKKLQFLTYLNVSGNELTGV